MLGIQKDNTVSVRLRKVAEAGGRPEAPPGAQPMANIDVSFANVGDHFADAM